MDLGRDRRRLGAGADDDQVRSRSRSLHAESAHGQLADSLPLRHHRRRLGAGARCRGAWAAAAPCWSRADDDGQRVALGDERDRAPRHPLASAARPGATRPRRARSAAPASSPAAQSSRPGSGARRRRRGSTCTCRRDARESARGGSCAAGDRSPRGGGPGRRTAPPWRPPGSCSHPAASAASSRRTTIGTGGHSRNVSFSDRIHVAPRLARGGPPRADARASAGGAATARTPRPARWTSVRRPAA